MRNVLFVALITVAACGAQSSNAPVTPAPTPAAPPPPASTSTSLTTDAEYEAAANELLNEMIGIFKAGATDCDKIAVDITSFLSRQGARIDAVNAYEESHDEARKAFEAKMSARDEEVNGVLVPAIEACDKHEGFDKAMKELEKH